ncbi:MAG: hypothetical protein U9O41_00495 [Candidatus Aerophobetes bacterium]|nr:hypothetical protein [Candidatus Aerophobetes bacterium]
MAKRNLRSEIAKKAYLDPKSSTFLNKTQSLIQAGYSEKYARSKGMKLLDNTKFTDTDLASFEPLVQGLPKLVALTNKKMEQLAQSDSISAKDYSAMLRHIELIAKCAGILKERIEKTERVIKIEMPKEIVESEHKRIRERELKRKSG